jgi:hypothetical protein
VGSGGSETGGAGGTVDDAGSDASETGGASGSGGTSGSGGATGSGGTSGSGGAAGAGGSVGSGGSVGTGGGVNGDGGPITDAAKDVVVTPDAPATCPDVYGLYAITDVSGKCGDLDKDAAQSIDGKSCALHFVSVGAINGGADLDANGQFSGAKLYEGTVQRSPCTGVWDQNGQTMTVVCGGEGDRCKVILARKAVPL